MPTPVLPERDELPIVAPAPKRSAWRRWAVFGLCLGQLGYWGCSDATQNGDAKSDGVDSPGGVRAQGGAGEESAPAVGGAGGQREDAEPESSPVPGFTAQYFAGYRELALTRVERSVDHLWAGEDKAPAEEVGQDYFSARFSALLTVKVGGTYEFATRADDGVRLWLGDALIIDDWRSHAPERHSARVELAPGTVTLRLEYFEYNYDAALTFFWTPPGASEQLLTENDVTTLPGIDAIPKPPYSNPVIAANRPDPGVLADGDPPVYYMVSTGGQFPIRRSYDLVLWEDTGGKILPDGKPAWAANGSRNWAPEIHRVGDKYIAYYTSVNSDNVLCIGAAVADSPTGPYADSGAPLVEHSQGVIDATYFRDKDQKHYLIYKIDGNASGKPTPIYLRELAKDGLSFAQGAAEVELLTNDSSTWEGGVVEAPWLIEEGGMYYLFYSGNVYDHRYRTGVARASSVEGPYQKHGAPLLQNNDTWVGPGHGSVVRAGANWYLVYHAWRNDGSGQRVSASGRQVLLDRVDFVNNWPVISDQSPSVSDQVWPGE